MGGLEWSKRYNLLALYYLLAEYTFGSVEGQILKYVRECFLEHCPEYRASSFKAFLKLVISTFEDLDPPDRFGQIGACQKRLKIISKPEELLAYFGEMAALIELHCDPPNLSKRILVFIAEEWGLYVKV